MLSVRKLKFQSRKVPKGTSPFVTTPTISSDSLESIESVDRNSLGWKFHIGIGSAESTFIGILVKPVNLTQYDLSIPYVT